MTLLSRKSWLLILHHFPMPALIWSNTANPAFLFQLLDYFLDAGTTQSKRIHHFLSGYSRFLPNHLQYFLPTFLLTFLLTLPRTLHPSFGRQRDDADKGVSFNELGLGALGIQGQVLAYIQDTRPEFLTTAHLHEELGKRRVLGIRSEVLRRDGAMAVRMRGVRYFRFCARGGE